MRAIRRLLAVITLAAVLLFGVLFAVQNSPEVPLDLVFLALPEQRVALWYALMFFFGGLLGLVAGGVAALGLAARQRHLQRRLKHCEAELARLRGGAPKR